MKRMAKPSGNTRSGTFAQMLAETRRVAARHTWARARTASHLAKLARGESRQRLYALKTAAIRRATELCPEAVSVDQFRWLDAGTLLLGVRFRGAGGLQLLIRSGEQPMMRLGHASRRAA